MSVETVLASAGKPEVFSYTQLVSSAKSLGRRDSQQIKSSKVWCDARGLRLADKARHADLGGVAPTAHERLSNLHAGVVSGQVASGATLVFESLGGVGRGELLLVVFVLVLLVRAGLKVVFLSEPRDVWTIDSVSLTQSVVKLFLAQEDGHVRSMRARMARRKAAQ